LIARASFLLCCLLAVLRLDAQSENHVQRRAGDKAYDRAQYREAESAYRSALEKSPADAAAAYNLGNAQYLQGNWEDAAKQFESAADKAPNREIRADALHNLGNAQLKQQQYDKAVKSFEQSLRLRPGDPGTRHNLQMAKQKLREQQQQQPQQDQQQEQNPSGEAGEQQNQNPQNPKPDPNKGQEKGQNPNQQPIEGPKDPEQQPEGPEMSKEEAERLLQNQIGPADQRAAKRYREREAGEQRKYKKKDW